MSVDGCVVHVGHGLAVGCWSLTSNRRDHARAPHLRIRPRDGPRPRPHPTHRPLPRPPCRRPRRRRRSARRLGRPNRRPEGGVEPHRVRPARPTQSRTGRRLDGAGADRPRVGIPRPVPRDRPPRLASPHAGEGGRALPTRRLAPRRADGRIRVRRRSAAGPAEAGAAAPVAGVAMAAADPHRPYRPPGLGPRPARRSGPPRGPMRTYRRCGRRSRTATCRRARGPSYAAASSSSPPSS